MPLSDYQLAVQHHNAGRLREAETLYRQILQKNPTDPNTLRMLGILASQVNRNDIAADFLQQALKLLPDNALLHAEFAEIQRRLGKFQQALHHATRAVALQNDLFDAHFNLAVIQQEQRNFPAAVDSYKRAIALNPKHAAAHYNLANIYREQASAAAVNSAGSPTSAATPSLDLAIAAYHTALELNPNYHEAKGNLALAHQAKGDLDDAIAILEKLAAAKPDDITAHTNLGNAWRDKGQLVPAMNAYRQALHLNPRDPATLNNIGKLLHDAGHLDDAITQYEKAIEAAPNRPEAFQNLGLAYEKLGKKDQAIAMYTAALERGGGASGAGDPRAAISLNARFHMAAATGIAPPPAAPATHVTELFEKLAGDFDQHLVGNLHYQTPQLMHDALLAVATTPATPAVQFQTTLDLGCGTGLCAPLFKPHTKTLIGIDLSPAMLEKARQRNLYDELIPGDLLTILKSRPFNPDLVLAADVFPYLGDLAPLFQTLAASLPPNALFAFSVESAPPDAAAGYTLKPTRRYAHTETYLRTLAKSHHFTLLSLTPVTLRHEANQPVPGFITILKRTPAPHGTESSL